MEPILSNIAKSAPRNVPHDLLSRLYREIGISAVAAALNMPQEVKATQPTAQEKLAALTSKAA